MGLILVDTSVWVEFLRDTGSAQCNRVTELLDVDAPMATTDVVIMELLAGAGSAERRRQVWALLNRCTMLPVRPLLDYEIAAHLYLRCRVDGFTPGSTNDLLVAAVAIGRDVPVLAADADFAHVARVSSLRLDS